MKPNIPFSQNDPSPDELRAWRNELLAARAAGVRRVEFRDRVVEYRTDGELAAAIKDIEDRLEFSLSGVRPTVTIHTIRKSRGWSL